MIEQTPLVVSEWHYNPPAKPGEPGEKIMNHTTLEVMRKRAATKKGIACRFSCRFTLGSETILQYVASDSYVIDPDDVIDRNELLTMIRNSFSKFKETFELRKLGTILRDKSIMSLNEAGIDIDSILPLLK
ncbi:MAG TPA: hypothetical protein VK498_04755 [Ferruginibacter sp.]|nr:hypothetical protein [Ferruginibacter sp.]